VEVAGGATPIETESALIDNTHGAQIPVAQALQTRFYPLPNFGSASVLQCQNFRENVTRAWDVTENIRVRIDLSFQTKINLRARFLLARI